MCGDINVNVLGNQKKWIQITRFLNVFALKWLACSLTRAMGSSATCIDNVISNIPENMIIVNVIRSEICHRFAQMIIIGEMSPVNFESWNGMVRDLNIEGVKELNFLLQNEKWEISINKNKNVNSNFETFNDRFMYYLNDNISPD